jgi:hypothetical protein
LQRQDQVPWRSKHLLLTVHTSRAPLVEIRYTGLSVVKASMGVTVTKDMKQMIQHMGQRYFVIANKVNRAILEFQNDDFNKPASYIYQYFSVVCFVLKISHTQNIIY